MSEADRLEAQLLREERDAWRERAQTFERVLRNAGSVLRDMTVGAPVSRAEIAAEGVEECLADYATPIDANIARRLSELPMSAWSGAGAPTTADEDNVPDCVACEVLSITGHAYDREHTCSATPQSSVAEEENE